MPTAYSLQAVPINGTTITGIKGHTLDRREKFASLGSDGNLHRTFVSLKRAAPMVGFSTVAVKTLLSVLTNADAPMAAITANADLIYAAQASAAPGYAGGGHIGRRIAAGHVYLDKLSWSAAGEGLEAAASIFALSSDGTTDPIASFVPTLAAPTSVEVYALTSATAGGQSLTSMVSAEVNISHKGENNDETNCFSLDLPYPTLMRVAGAGGPIEISGSLETLDQSVSPSATGTIVLVFTVRAFGAVTGASTITVTIAGAMIRETTRPATHGSPATRRFEFLARYDGTTKPITIVTT